MKFVAGIFKFIAWIWLIINIGAIGLMLFICTTGSIDQEFFSYISTAVLLILPPIVFLVWRHKVDKENKKYKGLTANEIKEKKLEEEEEIERIERTATEPEIIDGKKVYKFTQGGLAPVFVVIDGNWLSIKREGVFNALNHGLDGAKKIHLKNITAVQFKEASSVITEGLIQLVIPGSQESKRGLRAARFDENTIIFGTSNNELAKNLVSFMQTKIDELQVGQSQELRTQQQTQSVAQQLKDFKELLDSEIITQEEFNRKKEQLLG
jgi:hypothetical protein